MGIKNLLLAGAVGALIGVAGTTVASYFALPSGKQTFREALNQLPCAMYSPDIAYDLFPHNIVTFYKASGGVGGMHNQPRLILPGALEKAIDENSVFLGSSFGAGYGRIEFQLRCRDKK